MNNDFNRNSPFIFGLTLLMLLLTQIAWSSFGDVYDLNSINTRFTSIEESVHPSTQEPPLSPGDTASLFYNLPPAILTEPTGLFASPNRSEYVINVTIPAGETVYIMGRNATGSHLRVVWNTGVGWIPVSFTDYNADRYRLDVLPIFQREPPPCAIPLATQFSLDSEWKNTNSQRLRIAVVVDLFRTRYGDFPTSYLSLTVNGFEVDSSRRKIVERGQFTLKDVVFTMPGYIHPEDTVGYLLDTRSDEQLAFMATLFSVPEGCIWDTN
jgi:hypothetical protein